VTTEYIPNGVTLPKIRPAKLIKQWGLEKDNYIVTISRLVRHKGVQYLIEAYQQLATDKKLVIVGAGSFTDDYVKELHALAKNNPNIIFTGNQSGEILGELFSNASLFVQPSESEGLSIALLEAMAYELPCLVSDIPENIEAVEAVGFAFRNKDVDDLKNKLKFLLEHQALAKTHGKLGRDRVKEHYSWLDIGTKVSWLYDQVVMAKRTAKGFKLVRKFFMLF
jgi:glycosyltransferase involved in cell wall biosynthesis